MAPAAMWFSSATDDPGLAASKGLGERGGGLLDIASRLDSTRVLPPHLRAGMNRGAEYA
jgi:hypothetical protein